MQGGKDVLWAVSSVHEATAASAAEIVSCPVRGISSSSLLPTFEEVVSHGDEAGKFSPSPSRAAPVLPASFASSCFTNHDINAARTDASALHDTTILSDLSDEIQRVEARLAAIREEESCLIPQRKVSSLSTRECGRFCSASDFHDVECMAQLTASSCCCVNHLNDTGAASTEPGAPLCRNADRRSAAAFTNVSKRQKSQLHRIAIPPTNVNDLTNTVAEGEHHDPLASEPSTTGSLCEPSIEAVTAQLEPKGIVFSLATFLRPLRVVDIEIAAGVYEKLEVFAGEDMEEVARCFITKHGLDMERAFRPLYAFLMSLNLSEACKQNQESTTKRRASSRDGGNNNVATTSNGINYASSAGSMYGVKHGHIDSSSHVSEARTDNAANETAARRQSLDPVQPPSPRGVSMEKTWKVAAARGISQFEKRVSGCMASEEMSSFPRRSQMKIAYPGKHEHQRNTSVNSSKSLQVGSQKQAIKRKQEPCCNNTTPLRRNIEGGSEARRLSVKKNTPPEVGAVEVEVEVEAIKPTRRRTNSAPKVRPVTGGSTLTASLRNSTEQRRSLSVSKGRKFTLLEEEPMPTFKPSLAPRSRQLAAQDIGRRQGPTYARLHAHTPRLSKAHATAAAECIVKPKILPRQREDLSREPVGQRLYDQALDQKRRMQEKRIKEQQLKAEEEKRSITPGPCINKIRGRNNRGGESLSATSCSLRTRTPNQRNQNLDVLKTHEERELEECTFSPAVNPASVRMFNLVVRGLAVDEEPEEGARNSGVSSLGCAPSGGSRTQINENVFKPCFVEDRLLRHEQIRRRRLEEERLFRETVDVATGQPLFRPFLGR
ncbi:hypothetical protein TraAM80_08464 [Trypanosoma rangeli]|uniref:Uncharacterized protein n=1 Tax=Trypanosoma rangeli TaxID=5698 RepID=A0A422N0L4_TRYRA|nr:uncharacterized protein TraAM80_08464 [Trypanosoma rangeli]RNE99001.1 hypothetical protein TraAM80_08464 [Trypanosoma rangeli]|eukprot:RNE99001.1 hypothetical protein TraAM80_08464 [Trypanosoma rangeli]